MCLENRLLHRQVYTAELKSITIRHNCEQASQPKITPVSISVSRIYFERGDLKRWKCNVILQRPRAVRTEVTTAAHSDSAIEMFLPHGTSPNCFIYQVST